MRQRLTDPVRLGIIVGVRGIKGEVRIKSFTDEPTDIVAYGPLYDQVGERCFDLQVTGTQKGVVVARIAGVQDRNAAEAMKGTELFLDRSQLPPPDEDEFYLSDLEGLEAVSVTGERLGKVRGVYDFGAGTILELDGDLMVPFTEAVVPEIDLKGGRVVIDPPQGLLEPAEPEPGPDEDA